MRKIFNLILNNFLSGSVLVLILGVDLVACTQPSNPLMTENLKTVITALSAAEEAASNADILSFSMGSVYVKCMTDPQNFSTPTDSSVGPKRCEGLFRAMLDKLNKTKGFESLNLSDLKDPEAFKRIRGPLSMEDSGEDFKDQSGDQSGDQS